MDESSDPELDAMLRAMVGLPSGETPDPFREVELTPGDRVMDRYRVGPLLGSGGMGAVFEALDERLQRTVAIKVMRPELTSDAALSDRFRREALAASRVEHPNIVRVIDYELHDGRAYLVMERLRGESLKQRLERTPRLSVEAALEILAPIMSALAFAHERGVVHRDIKPANVFLADEGGRVVPKILDFGVAKLTLPELVRLTASGRGSLGTPTYMAPEQFRRAHEVGPSADQYAFATVLYQVLGGRLPYEEKTPERLVVAKATTIAGPPHGAPKAIAAVLLRALSPSPEARYPSMRAMEQELYAALQPQRRRPLRWPAIALVVTIALVVSALVLALR
jgi:serine/threonine protein kinase